MIEDPEAVDFVIVSGVVHKTVVVRIKEKEAVFFAAVSYSIVTIIGSGVRDSGDRPTIDRLYPYG